MNDEIIDIKHENKRKVTNANFATESILNSLNTIQAFSSEILDTKTLIEQLCTQFNKVTQGNTERLELMLMSHAQTLDVIFHSMMRRSAASEYMQKLQIYSDLGFKAQNQLRKTLLALVEIKNPKKATFIKQQNNAVNQQVNNNIKSKKQRKTKKVTNELLSEAKYEAVDDRREAETIAINPPMETVGNGGSKNARR